MEYSPPPLFKQGASARVKVTFFALISLALLFADSRVHTLTKVRRAISTALYPLQMVALMPRDAAYSAADYFVSLTSVEKENARLRQQQILNAQALQQAQHLSAENAQLRKLLGASEKLPVKSLLGEILYDARDAFSSKVILNRGTRNGVMPGQPVIDDVGVVGQVTRVSPFTSEVTLLTDKDQAIPVQVVRSGLRSVAYGRGQSGVLDLRFMAASADIRKGDMLVTSGIDGVYPAGLSVATVVEVENKSSDAFAHILCQPTAGIDRNRQLLILLVDSNIPPHFEDEAFDHKPLQEQASGEISDKTSAQPAARTKEEAKKEEAKKEKAKKEEKKKEESKKEETVPASVHSSKGATESGKPVQSARVAKAAPAVPLAAQAKPAETRVAVPAKPLEKSAVPTAAPAPSSKGAAH